MARETTDFVRMGVAVWRAELGVPYDPDRYGCMLILAGQWDVLVDHGCRLAFEEYEAEFIAALAAGDA